MNSILHKRFDRAMEFSRRLPDLLHTPTRREVLPFRAWGDAVNCVSCTRITGFRSLGATEILGQIRTLAADLGGPGQDLLAALVCDGREWALYLGTSRSQSLLERQVESLLPMVQQQRPDPGDPLFRSYPYGGCVGNLGPLRARWDLVLRRIGSTPCILALLLKAAPELLEQDLNTLDGLCRDLEQYATRRVPMGFTGSQSRTMSDELMLRGQQTAAGFRQRIQSGILGHCHVGAFWYGAMTPEGADAVGSILEDSLEPGEGNLRGRAYAQPLDMTTFQFDGLYLPWLQRGGLPGLPLLQNPLVDLLPPEEAAALVPIPQDSHLGFWVDLPLRDENSFHEFDITPHAVQGQPVPLGTITGSGQEAALGTLDLGQHALLCGSSGAGKSTTIRKLIVGLDRLHIPILIMEPVKGSFSDLPSYGVETTIYSSGIGGIPLEFNPFIPEEMTTIHSHIKSLCTAITAATDNESPIPQALEMVITQAYRDHGWESGDMVLPGHQKTFPTFREVRDMIMPFFRNCGLYQGEVRTNVSSALYVRLTALAGFRFLQGSRKLPVAEILGRNTLIRFDGLDMLPDKCAFANFVLININEHLRAQGTFHGLRQVIILDEAHNFLLKPTGTNSSAAAVSEFFGNLLSEIREYGVGMVVADQRVSILNQSVVENTGIKVLHAMSSQEDEQIATGALKLTEYQRQLFQTLPLGRAVVSIRGQRPIIQVQVEKPQAAGTSLCQMCRYCRFSHLCCRDAVLLRLEDAPIGDWCASLLGVLGDEAQLKQAIRQIFRDLNAQQEPPHIRQCLFGHIVERGIPGDQYRQFLNHVYTQYKE